jgi:hypothetical protein
MLGWIAALLLTVGLILRRRRTIESQRIIRFEDSWR